MPWSEVEMDACESQGMDPWKDLQVPEADKGGLCHAALFGRAFSLLVNGAASKPSIITQLLFLPTTSCSTFAITGFVA